MNYPPIGGYEHGPQCDEGDPARMCSECLVEADRDWILDDRGETD